MEIVRDTIRGDLGDECPKLTIEIIGRRRAVLVRFGDPVTPGQADFTADVMTAIPHPSGRGLYIPNTKIADQWDRADPVTHTRMVLQAIADTDVVFAAPSGLPRADVHKRLCTARRHIDLTIEHEKAGRPLSAQHVLHQVLPELVPDADGTQEEVDRLARTVRSGGTVATGLGLATGLVTPTRAWGD